MKGMIDAPLQVLLIDPAPEPVVELVSNLNRDEKKVALTLADDLVTGMEQISTNDIDVVLLDPVLPDCTPERVFTEVMARGQWPIVLFCDADREPMARIFVQRGAYDYLIKQATGPGRLLHTLRTIRDRSLHDRNLDREQWKRIFEGIGDAVTMQRHDDMRIVYANEAACKLLNRPCAELEGRPCYFVFRGATKPCDGCSGSSLLHDHRFCFSEIAYPNLDKSFQVTASPVFNRNGQLEYILHMARDVTRFMEIKKRYRQAQKLEAVGRVTGEVAHNFNNLLTGIIGFAERELLKGAEEKPSRGNLEQIVNLGRRGADLIRQLLYFSMDHNLEPFPCNMNRQIVEIFDLLAYLAGSSTILSFRPAPKLEKVMADPGQLDQLVTNLVVNAGDAINGNGRISIRTAMIVPENGSRAMVMLEVSDNGCGMDEEIKDRIFEPFFTTKEVGKGTGLGLSSVYASVQQHNGKIQVDSAPGQGSSFKVFLPAIKGFAGSALQ